VEAGGLVLSPGKREMLKKEEEEADVASDDLKCPHCTMRFPRYLIE